MTRAERVLALGVAVAAAVWAWPALQAGYEGPYDEGNTLGAAWRVAGGERLYRDVWSLHAPGTTWLLAGAFRLFGATLCVERAAKAAVLVAAAVLVFLLGRRAARPWAAAGAALLFLALPSQTLSLRSRDTGLVIVLATLCAASAPGLRPKTRAILTGLLAGLTVWFKQDFALAAVLASVLALALDKAMLTSSALLRFAAGLAAGPVSLTATLAAQGTLEEFCRQAILFPATSFALFRALPLSLRFEQLCAAMGPGISAKGVLEVAAVPILFVGALAAALMAGTGILAGLRREDAPLASPVPLAASLACVLLLAAPFQRADLEHLNPALALALVVLATTAAPLEPARASRARLLAGLSIGALVVLVSAPAALSHLRLVRAGLLAGRAAGATGLVAAPRWIGLPADLAETASFVARETRPDERIFVGDARHDALAYGASLAYFLAGRKGATRYDNLHPGIVTARPAQEEIVRDLEARGTRIAVLWDGPPLDEPNASSASSGVTLLDEWLAANAGETVRFGAYRVTRLRERVPPPAAAP